MCYHLITISSHPFRSKSKRRKNKDELVNLIVKKTGIPAATAQTVVNIVVDYLKKKLPAPIAGQIDGLLSNTGNVENAGKMLGGLMGKK